MWRFISFVLISLAFTVWILPVDAHAEPSAAPSQVSAAPGAAASAPQEKYESPSGHAKTQPADGHKIAKKRDQKLPRMMIVVTATRMKTPLGEVGTATSVVTDTKIQAQQMHDVTNALREV